MCTGTGSEEYAKLTDTIYFHDDDSLYVNLFVDSSLEWPEKGMRFVQATRFPEEHTTTLTITAKRPTALTVNHRIPYWTREGSGKINGTGLPAFASPSSYLSVRRAWTAGDKIELSLPMALHVDRMPDNQTMQAVMYGALVLAGRFDLVSNDMLYGEYGPKANAQAKVPDIVAAPTIPPPGWNRTRRKCSCSTPSDSHDH